MNLKVNEEYIKSKFMDGIYEYISNYFQSKNGIIYKPKVDYMIPNEEYIAKHWKEIHNEICLQKPICEFSDELKAVAKQYLPIFIATHPECKDAQCLEIK